MMKFKSDSSTGRMARNSLFVLVRFGLYTLSGIIFIPYLREEYGSGSFGLIALAGFLTQYVGLISRCIGNSTARYLNIALNRNDWTQANEIFSTALVANLVLILLQLPLFALGIWKLDWLIDFSPEIGADFRVLVICNVFVFFMTLISGVFLTPMQASNRLDISTTIESCMIVLRMVLIFACVTFVGARLWIIGAVDVLLALVNGGIMVAAQKKLAPGLLLRRGYMTLKWVKPILNMSGWSLLAVLGGALFLKTDIWMINRFVNMELAGVYAVLLVWPNFLKQISKQVDSVVTPVYMIDFAKGDLNRMAVMSITSAKLLTCLIAGIVGVMLVIAPFILRVWLGPWATEYAGLFRIMIIYVVFAIGESVIWPIFIAVNKVHLSGLVSLSAGIINIILSMSLIWSGFGAMGVAIGTGIASILAGGIVMPIFACRVLHVPITKILEYHISGFAVLLASWGSMRMVVSLFHTAPVSAVLAGMLAAALGCTFVYRIVFSSQERVYTKKIITTVFDRLGMQKSTAGGSGDPS